MPSAAQKQRRRKLKQKKEQKKGQNDDRIEPYVRRRIRRATESLSSNYGTSDRLIRLLEDALAAAEEVLGVKVICAKCVFLSTEYLL